uniref:PDZ domain-containing protein n=1 Tax=Sinocyclocheilus rhinocerous TaxID=307959 RepID=A0A673IPT5_9TELE
KEIIVKTVKEVCAEGLIVSGGKDGIFIKDVKPESPASKHLSVKEGDQILSATVYFDNVSYEDALQILEHAQPYKVAFCLKRKPPPRTQEDAETMSQASSEVSLTLYLLHQCLQ